MRWGIPTPSLRGLREPRFRRFLFEMSKVMVIGLVAQVNVVLLRLLASLLAEGSVTQYWYANRVVDLAQGAIAVGVGSALLPAIARDAVERHWERFRAHFAEAVFLAAIVMLPAAGLLLGLAGPIVAILFLHGQFDSAAAAHTSATLQLLVPFMLALAGINIVKKAFFALEARGALLAVGAVGLLVTAGLGYPLSLRLGVEGLGLSLSISTTVQLLAYVVILRRKMGTRLGLRALVAPVSKLVVASVPAVLLAVVICGAGRWEEGPASLLNWALLAASGIVAAVVYLGVAWVLNVKELRRLLRRGSPEEQV